MKINCLYLHDAYLFNVKKARIRNKYNQIPSSKPKGKEGVVGWCECAGWGVLLIWIIVGQGPIALDLGAGGVVWTFFLLLFIFFSFSASCRAA